MWTELRSRRIATGISVKATSPEDNENGYAIADLTMAAVDPGITVHLRDRALFVVTPADGQCCEGFTRVGEGSGPARERLIAADDNVNVARIELCAAAHPPRILGGDEGRAGTEEGVEHNVAPVR